MNTLTAGYLTIVTACAWSTCRLTGQQIRPGTEIVPWQGSWAIASEVRAHDQRQQAFAEFRAQVMYLVNRLPERAI